MDNIINLTSKLENTYWLSNSPKRELFLYISLKAGKAPEKNERVPVNISLVIDRSGSMQGEKLDYVKKAVKFVVDNLNQEDYISVVQYDNQVDVVSESSRVQNKKVLQNKVDKIRAGGSTNLSGGMLEGYNQVRKTKKEGYVNRILLLSDGLANQGITVPEKLQQIAQKTFREQGIATSSFGVGADFNEILMTNLAEYGGANYYYIDTPDQIPNIFAEELSGLLSVVAQNTVLKLSFPKEFLTCKKVYGYPATTQMGQVDINFNDIFSEEEKAILIKFEVNQQFNQNLDFEIDLQYDDVVNKLEHIQEVKKLTLQSTQDTNLYEQNIDKEAIMQTAFFVSNDMLEEAIRIADDITKLEEAKKIIAQAKMYLETQFKHIVPNEELKRQYQSILDYEKRLGEMVNMSKMDYLESQKSSRSFSYKLRKKRGF